MLTSPSDRPRTFGWEADDQRAVDLAMLELDGTPNKGKLGANAILGVPGVGSRRRRLGRPAAVRYVGGPNAHVLRFPHEHLTARRLQRRHPEFMIAPIGASSFSSRWVGRPGVPRAEEGSPERGLSTGLGDERFRAELDSNAEALDLIIEAIEAAGLKPGAEIALALDVAASEFCTDGLYSFEGGQKTAEEMTAYYAELVAKYPLVSIEDPLDEDDWDGWKKITDELGDKVQLVGDDLFVTNPERLARGVATNTANALLVKVNQIGSLTETLDAGDGPSRRLVACVAPLGETEDVTIADLAVATSCGQIRRCQLARARLRRPASADRQSWMTPQCAGASAFPRFRPDNRMGRRRAAPRRRSGFLGGCRTDR